MAYYFFAHCSLNHTVLVCLERKKSERKNHEMSSRVDWLVGLTTLMDGVSSHRFLPIAHTYAGMTWLLHTLAYDTTDNCKLTTINYKLTTNNDTPPSPRSSAQAWHAR